MKYSIKAFIRKDEAGYVAECLEVDAVVRGATLDETVDSLRRELCQQLEGADMSALGLVEDPTLFITFEDVPLQIRPMDCAVDYPNI